MKGRTACETEIIRSAIALVLCTWRQTGVEKVDGQWAGEMWDKCVEHIAAKLLPDLENAVDAYYGQRESWTPDMSLPFPEFDEHTIP